MYELSYCDYLETLAFLSVRLHGATTQHMSYSTETALESVNKRGMKRVSGINVDCWYECRQQALLSRLL